MGRKKKGGGGGGEQKKPAEEAEAEKKANSNASGGVTAAVLKVDMHCEGCAKRIRKSIKGFPGVEGVRMEVGMGRMTVVGRFEAKKLRERVAAKTKKNVELINNAGGKKDGQKNNSGQPETEEEEEESCGKRKQEKGNKEASVPAVGTVVLKIGATGLHCDGCIRRIRQKLFKIEGVEQVAMDVPKNQVTVTGTMDTKALPDKLREKLRRPVNVVAAPPPPPPPPNKKEKEQYSDDEARRAQQALLKAEMEVMIYNPEALLAPQFSSDENPNAYCSLM